LLLFSWLCQGAHADACNDRATIPDTFPAQYYSTWSPEYEIHLSLLPRRISSHVSLTYVANQVINGIQTGPYRNIYNPENFFVGKQGIGAGNNWGAGYAAGDIVQEEIFDMIDREADGSDSLEVIFAITAESRCWFIRSRLTCPF